MYRGFRQKNLLNVDAVVIQLRAIVDELLEADMLGIDIE